MVRKCAILTLISAALPLLSQPVAPVLSTEAPAAGLQGKEFVDPESGVGFRYPEGWKFMGSEEYNGPDSLLTPEELKARDAAEGFKVKAFVSMSEDAWPQPVRRTNFSGADFTFEVAPGATVGSCIDRARKNWNTGNGKLDQRRMHGIPFRYATADGAWTGHQIRSSLYVHQQNNTCYLFDLAVRTAGTIEGQPDLSSKAARAVELQLEKILSTVTIDSSLNPSLPNKHP